MLIIMSIILTFTEFYYTSNPDSFPMVKVRHESRLNASLVLVTPSLRLASVISLAGPSRPLVLPSI